jgi:2-keto-4-pentenoate hydratase/2-oxohepta-3-ene-1,7-dioic acid hydratase in catechol pathway
MKLARYTLDGTTSVGVVVGDRVIPLKVLGLPVTTTIREILAAGAAMRQQLGHALKTSSHDGPLLSRVRLEVPVPDAQKYLAIGLNYRDHLDEVAHLGVKAPPHQLWFNKQVSCLTGPYDPVFKPRVSTMLDFEAELGVVIGKRCRYVSAAEAPSVVGGYFVLNDVTARDWQVRSPTYTLGKSFDSHGPIGPWVTTADEVTDPHALQMRLWVNGELRQSTSTGGMIYNIWQQIEELTQVMTLEPGDLIATGTCSGSGVVTRRFLQPGDLVKVEIEGLGHIENSIEAEPEGQLRL